MKILEKIFRGIGITSIFLTLIWFFGVGVYETVYMKPFGNLISKTPDLAWVSGIMYGLIGLTIITLLAWALLSVRNSWD